MIFSLLNDGECNMIAEIQQGKNNILTYISETILYCGSYRNRGQKQDGLCKVTLLLQKCPMLKPIFGRDDLK